MSLRILAAAFIVASAPFPLAGQAPPASPPAEERKVLVVAAKVPDLEEDHYLWGAEMAAARLKGSTTVVEGGLAGGLRYARENEGAARGIVEVMIDVHTYVEEVRITCFDTAGRVLWKEKAKANMGGTLCANVRETATPREISVEGGEER